MKLVVSECVVSEGVVLTNDDTRSLWMGGIGTNKYEVFQTTRRRDYMDADLVAALPPFLQQRVGEMEDWMRARALKSWLD